MSHRVIQAFDTAQFIESTRGESVIQILAGDLNTEPGDLAYRVLVATSKLTDSYEQSGSVLAGTNEGTKNSYTSPDVARELPKGKRIDYIMTRPGSTFTCEILKYTHPLPDRVSGKPFSYSDHEAVYAKISIQRRASNLKRDCLELDSCPERLADEPIHDYSRMSETVNALRESIKICDESLRELDSHKKSYILMTVGMVTVLFCLIDIFPPNGLKSLYMVLKIFLSGLALFFLFMATIWNVMEKHGILSGKISMEIAQKNVEQIIYNNENLKNL